MGQKWSKMCFSKSHHRLFGMLKQVFWAHFQPVLMGLAPSTTCMHHVVPFARTFQPYGGAT